MHRNRSASHKRLLLQKVKELRADFDSPPSAPKIPAPATPVRRDPDFMMKSELIEELECAPLRHAALPRARVLAWFQRLLYVSAG